MRVLITGMNGTVAPVLAAELQKAHAEVTPWDRAAVAVDHFDSVREFILQTRPDACLHLAMGGPEWAEWMARVCKDERISFLYTSSVSVFANTQRGPFGTDVAPQPDDDYGRYKLDCEQRVRAAYPDALVARLGWQIGTAPGSNNMIDYLEKTHRAEGAIRASRCWVPACSFLEDTAVVLAGLLRGQPGGLYHVDGNPGWSLYDIAVRLNTIHGSRWQVIPADEPDWDTRMTDHRITTPSIVDRLAG
jgi:dTDP-4-dehydrorhamnose reductase